MKKNYLIIEEFKLSFSYVRTKKKRGFVFKIHYYKSWSIGYIFLQVQDVNDEAPTFESETYYVSVAENTPSGSNVVKGMCGWSSFL